MMTEFCLSAQLVSWDCGLFCYAVYFGKPIPCKQGRICSYNLVPNWVLDSAVVKGCGLYKHMADEFRLRINIITLVAWMRLLSA